MKKSILLKTTILLLGGGCIIAALSSCENFLKAHEVKEQIEEAIEIANSSAITYFVTAQEGSGTVTPNQIKVKKKETFDLRFKPASDWKFICWEVINTTTGQVEENSIKFENPDQTETKAYVINPNPGLQIHAKCVQIPCIVDVEPKTASYANIPITIKFNIPVEPEDITEPSIFNFTNIKITCNGEIINDKFEEPVFNTDKTELTIKPKSVLPENDYQEAVLLVDYIKNELNTGSIQVDVTFSDSIVVEKEELKFEIMNPKFSVYYVPETDKLPPVSHKFFLTQDSSITLDNAESFSGNTFHKEEIASRPDGLSDSAYKEKLLQNMCNDVVYIYGRYSDDGSGVKSVVVNEVMTNDFYGYRCYRVDYVAKEYKEGSDNIIFRTVNNETTFLIKHVLTYQPKEDEFYYGGAYSLEIIVNDYCYNNTEPEKFTVINNRKINFEENYAGFSQLPIDISDWVDYEQYKASYISFLNSYYLYFLYSDFTLYNKVGYDKDDLTIKLQYFDSKKQLQSVTPSFVYGHYCVEDYGPDEQYFWDCYKMTFNAAGLTIWPDTSMKIVVENKFGATYEDSLATFPVDNTELFFEVYEENNIKKIRVYDKDGMGQSGFRLIRTNKLDHTVQCSTKHEIEEGYDYQVMFGNVINSRVRFTGDNISLDDTIDEIVIEHFEIKKSREGYLVANITLNENVWSYYDNITYEDTYWHRCESVPKGSNSFSKEFEQSKIYENPYTTEQTPYNICTIYGYRNNLRTNGTPCEISKVSRTDASLVDKKKYDCEAPFFMFNMKGNEVELIMEDQFSGIDTGKIEAKGKTYLFNSETTSYTTPLSELISSKDDYSLIHFYGKDIAGNVRDEYINSYTFIKPLYGRIIKDDNHTSAVTMKLDVGLSTEKCYVYDFKVKEDGTVIGFPTEYKDSDATIVYTKEFNEQTNAWDIGVIEKTQFQNNNTYYKIVWKYQRYMGSVTSYPFNVFTNSIYCYSGTPGSGENDFLIPNGNSKKSVVINSDKPVFVHTVATSVPLKECRNWDLTEWEYYKEECGEKILDFSSTSSPKVYNIPEIEKGKCYVVIAHYSDNHVLMSDIMVK